MLHIWKNASIAIQAQDFTPQRFGDLKQMLEVKNSRLKSRASNREQNLYG